MTPQDKHVPELVIKQEIESSDGEEWEKIRNIQHRYHCSKCQKEFESYSSCLQHEQTHQLKYFPENEFQLLSSTNSLVYLPSEDKWVQEKQFYVCDICKIGYTDKKKLSRHILDVHINEPPLGIRTQPTELPHHFDDVSMESSPLLKNNKRSLSVTSSTSTASSWYDRVENNNSPSARDSEITDEMLMTLSVRELNLRLQKCTKEQAKMLRAKRRTLKNRGYAQNCRTRRVRQKEDLEITIRYMKHELKKTKAELKHVTLEKNQLKEQLIALTKIKNDEVNQAKKLKQVIKERDELKEKLMELMEPKVRELSSDDESLVEIDI